MISTIWPTTDDPFHALVECPRSQQPNNTTAKAAAAMEKARSVGGSEQKHTGSNKTFSAAIQGAAADR